MELDYFQTENKKCYAAVLWMRNGDCREWYYDTLEEAKTRLKRMFIAYNGRYSEGYLREYDEYGCAIKTYDINLKILM